MNEFLLDLNNEIFMHSSSNGETNQDSFFQLVTDFLVEDSVCIDAQIINDWNNDKSGIQINGYGGDPSEDENTLTIFLVDYIQSDEVIGMNMAELTALVKRGANYINKLGNKNFINSLEKTGNMYLISQFLSNKIDYVDNFRFIILTNKLLKIRSEQIDTPIINNIKSKADIWDLDRIKKLYEGKNTKEEIIIDLEKDFNSSIPVLRADLTKVNYASYLAVLNGDLLARIYERWGNRLLERNVRVFLQGRVKVNKDIRKTIEDRPEMFFAFNNGITATADFVKIETLDNARVITRITNLQIVNGGQTTSSLFAAFKKNIPLKEVYVQMKLSEIKDQQLADELVPEISRCANSQNKVKSTDFSSSHPFHREIEKLSRRIFAPTANNQIKPSKWYYERVRGQYLDNKSKLTGSEKRKFEAEYPKNQYFQKTDLGRYLNSWDMLPFIVSKGPEKNFAFFTESIEKDWEKNKDLYGDFFFKVLIGKNILWNTIKRLASKNNGILNYGINVTTYTVAKLSYDIPKSSEFDFLKIWNNQAIRSDFENTLLRLVIEIYEIIISPPMGQNSIPSEFAKNEKCWDVIKELAFKWDNSLEYYLASKQEMKKLATTSKKEKKLTNDLETEIIIATTKGAFWAKLDDWISINSLSIQLSGSESTLLRNARGIPRTFFPNAGQSKRLLVIYERAVESGFPGRLKS